MGEYIKVLQWSSFWYPKFINNISIYLFQRPHWAPIQSISGFGVIGRWGWYLIHIYIYCWLYNYTKRVSGYSRMDYIVVSNWSIFLFGTWYVDAAARGADIPWTTDITSLKISWSLMVMRRQKWYDVVSQRGSEYIGSTSLLGAKW